MNRRTFLNTSALASGIVFRGGMPIAQAAKVSGGGSPIVETTGGKIRGVQSGKVFSFKGVHYGAITTGKMRFMPPAKVQPWADVKDALDIGQRAPQLPGNLVPEYAVMERTEPMGGDCLCLNVFTTGIKDGRKRPVMFWLHGGGFSAGSGGGNVLYDGSNLALKHDVTVVTINHRLNVFGFMYLADIGGERFAQASNAGMLDVVLALEWVRDNAATFGGDPGNVTIFGQSGGGSKVSTLLGDACGKRSVPSRDCHERIGSDRHSARRGLEGRRSGDEEIETHRSGRSADRADAEASRADASWSDRDAVASGSGCGWKDAAGRSVLAEGDDDL